MPQRLKILVVDDEENARVMLQQMAAYMGHDALLAKNGVEAVELFRSEAPDLVLMDVMMPGLDGFQATSRIRAMATERWVPVVFLTALQRDGNMLKGLDAGGDDYIVKPVNLAELRAKIGALQRVTMLQRRLAEKRAELEFYYRQSEEEGRIGSYLMANLTSAAGLKDEALQHWSRPRQRFSGDLVAAARTPGNVLHVMVADAVGHGLPAALNVLPLADTFYRMTSEGFGIASIVEELNRKLKSLLPVDRFVAATLVSVDGYKKEIQVWNGGNPVPLFVNAAGAVREFGKTRQLPLGLLHEPRTEAVPDVMACHEPGQLVLFTDGLSEAQDGSGAYWGSAGIARALTEVPPAQRFRHLLDGFQRYVAAGGVRDDASFIMVDIRCAQTEHHVQPPVTAAGAAEVSGAEPAWRVDFSFGARELKSLDAIPFLTSVVDVLESSNVHRRQVFIILSELFNNAVEHGLLHLDSKMKSGLEGFENYMHERRIRLDALRDGRVDISLERVVVDGRGGIRIRVKDTGPGFDHAAVDLNRAGSSTEAHGRGILLVNSLCQTLEYRGNGSEAVCHYCL